MENYFYNPEMMEARTMREWVQWFEEHKTETGYDDVEDWWEECRIRHGLLLKLNNIVAVFDVNGTRVIIEQFDHDDFSIYFDGGSYRDEWQYIAEYFEENFAGAKLENYVN